MNVCTALRRFALAASLALAACGGGGGGGSSGGSGSGGDDESSLEWDRSTYTVDTHGHSARLTVKAGVVIHSPAPIAQVGVRPITEDAEEFLAYAGPFGVTFGFAPIDFEVAPDSTGHYRKGKFVFEADMKIGDKKYTDRTTLVVK